MQFLATQMYQNNSPKHASIDRVSAGNTVFRRMATMFCNALIPAALTFASMGVVAHSQTANSPQDGSVLPIPLEPFQGIIEKTFEGSQQDYPQPLEAPEGAPNIVLILIDDLGFGQPGTFGGPVPTPAMDALAEEGLRFTRITLPLFVLPRGQPY